MKRTKQERQKEVRIIIDKLTELKLTVIYEPVRDLMSLLREYIQEGEDIKINIPFNEIKKTIVGRLFACVNTPCWLKLTTQ
tara:strand:- start:310 stop:552 length:243 start_codon:yes stop_codon:yes gene_type:complete